MGRKRSKYEKHHKQPFKTVVDESSQKKIKLDLEDIKEDKYDSSNTLVLPSAKRTTKKLRNKNAAPVKLLSKRQRKKLEKIVDIKEKKEKRSNILSELEELQADQSQLANLLPYEVTQTLGRKKYLTEDYFEAPVTNLNIHETAPKRISSIKGAIKNITPKPPPKHPNVVELKNISSSSEDDDLENENEGVEIEINPKESISSGLSVEMESENEVSKDYTIYNNDEMVSRVVPEISEVDRKPAVYKILNRDEAVQKSRLKLPILSEEQSIMEAIKENLITIIYGPTGSGKTTQVPQFLYEAGYTSDDKMIAVTEPRRVAAISMSQRVAHEMNLKWGGEIGYQIRFEGNVNDVTKIKFMTDGVLLSEMQKDPRLRKYSAIIIDEAHERSVHSDILIGFLTRIVVKRQEDKKPLRLIIMSATLRVEDFTENKNLLKSIIPPVIKVDSRMYEVTKHFNKKTPDNYVESAYKKICKIHRKLPEGGILIFLTGQQEIHTLMRWLSKTFPQKQGDNNDKTHISNYRKRKIEAKQLFRKIKKGEDSKEDLEKNEILVNKIKLEDFNFSLPDQTEEEIQDDENLEDKEFDEDSEEEEYDPSFLTKPMEKEQPLYILPLYSMLPSHKQRLVFDSPPEGTRLCVIATNVAETSLTIPNIKYVVDTGKVKEKLYDKVTGVSTFHVTWISQASAEQRAGRAGRTAPGHCYRLYSSAVFNEFEKFALPEIQKRPIDDVVLLMKSMSLPVINFPYPSPPNISQIKHGIRRLLCLGALEGNNIDNSKNNKFAKDKTKITELGRLMSLFPVAPRFGKLLALSDQHNLLPYTVTLVAALTVPEVLKESPLDESDNAKELWKKWLSKRLSWSGSGNLKLLGDPAVLLRAIGEAEYLDATKEYCDKNGLRHKGVVEIRKLRQQLTKEINLISDKINLVIDPKMEPPSDYQCKLLRQLLLLGLVDHIARRVDESSITDPVEKVKWKNSYRSVEVEEPVFLSSSSVLSKEKPEWVVYQDLYESNKLLMRGVTAIEPEWMCQLAPHMCTFSPPLESPPPRYCSQTDAILCHRSAVFGPQRWEIPETEVEYPREPRLLQYFAYFFLEGDICPLLKPFTTHLYETKTLIAKVAFRYKEKRCAIIEALRKLDITSLTQLTKVWQETPSYLLKEYLMWVQDDTKKLLVQDLWPPIEKEINEWD